LVYASAEAVLTLARLVRAAACTLVAVRVKETLVAAPAASAPRLGKIMKLPFRV